jgi:hypothetical protein
MRFNQVRVSPTLENTFGKNFRNKWSLQEYTDPSEPAIFFGLYTDSDLQALLNHKNKSLVVWGGADMRDPQLSTVRDLVNSKKCSTLAYPGIFSKTLSKYSIPHKELYIPVKDYSRFKSIPLGDKIYVYKGINGNRSQYFQWEEVIVPVIKHFGESSVIYTNSVSLDSLVEDFYAKSFIYVKPSPKGGCTAMFELGCMGRKTTGQGYHGLSNFITYKNTDHLMKIIGQESKKIGTLQDEVSLNTHSVFVGPDWLNLDFWKK